MKLQDLPASEWSPATVLPAKSDCQLRSLPSIAGSISPRKPVIESAKFNVLTA